MFSFPSITALPIIRLGHVTCFCQCKVWGSDSVPVGSKALRDITYICSCAYIPVITMRKASPREFWPFNTGPRMRHRIHRNWPKPGINQAHQLHCRLVTKKSAEDSKPWVWGWLLHSIIAVIASLYTIQRTALALTPS